MAFLFSRRLPLFLYRPALKWDEVCTEGVIPCIRTCYVHAREAAGDGRPVVEARHALIEANMARLKGGDGERAAVELHARQRVLVQGKASEAPGHRRRRRIR